MTLLLFEFDAFEVGPSYYIIIINGSLMVRFATGL